MSRPRGPVVVVSPAPTANGDLHVGHLAGPFLAADVYTRYLRATGREALFTTGVQDTSTFVVTTAHRRGLAPRELVSRSAREIQATLAAVGIDVDGFTGVEERFAKLVVDVLDRLHAAGRLRLRTITLPYAPRTGEYLVDGFVQGNCPTCLAFGCAGLCESCGYPVAAGDLIDPRSTLHPDDPVEMREVPVLVLPLEEYRTRLREYLTAGPAVRPHMAEAIEDMLSGPLPDYPISYPISWGIPAPFPEVAGQVVNPNAEPLAWSLYATALAAERRGGVLAADDELWRPEAGTDVVYFLGFDNIFPFAVTELAMLFALGEQYALPRYFVTNEFYELDHEKFSTSRGHVVRGADLTAEVPRDLIRFYLASTSPEFQRTSFGRDALFTVARTRLVEPWNRVAVTTGQWAGAGPLPVSARSRAAAARMVARFDEAYRLPRFSLGRIAEILTDQLARLDRARDTVTDPGDFCHETDILLRCAAPILIDLAGEALTDRSIPAVPRATRFTPARLPLLSLGTG